MKPKFRIRVFDVLIVAALAGLIAYNMRKQPEPKVDQFVQDVDLEPLNLCAVQADGRIRSFESHANSFMTIVTGGRKIDGQTDGFTYLDMMFHPAEYRQRDVVFVKNKLVRQEIVEALETQGFVDERRAKQLNDKGLFPPALLRAEPSRNVLAELGQDLVRTAKSVDQVSSALFVSDASLLLQQLRTVVPRNAELETQWVSLSELARPAGLPQDEAHAGLGGNMAVSGVDPTLQGQIAETWSKLATAWKQKDAEAVNAHIAHLAGFFRSTANDLYPSQERLAWESWYFKNHSMTWVWMIYLLCVPPLLMGFIYKWKSARWVGLGIFAVAFALQTMSVFLRWYISGRWPNSNMFEAVTTAAWFGGVGAIVLEFIARKSALRNMFALASAVMSMVALMAVHFLPAYADSAIRNKMAALNDVWLYIHTNVIIFSYIMIGLACVPAMLLLRHRWCRAWDEGTIPKPRLLMLPVVFGLFNVMSWVILMYLIQYGVADLAAATMQTKVQYGGMVILFLGSGMFLALELFAARDRALAGGTVERASSGGASALIMGTPAATPFLKDDKPGVGQVLDAATMIIVEIAFIMLFIGTIMGAIWADHAWGRPWGWDPKEVFALNTFFIFLILVHIRLKVRDKAFWTAILAVLGFQVMLFNWVVVNFVITGLHSYA